MSAAPEPLATAVTSLWQGGALTPREDCDVAPAIVRAADSWLVDDGAVRGLALHRERFLSAVDGERAGTLDVDAFWDAAIAAIPRTGAWFPRVEYREQSGAAQLLLRLREAPERRRSITLATHAGRDPRTEPAVKGPDLSAMLRLRGEAQLRGADEAVILSPDGEVVEGSTTSLLWWRDDELRVPDAALVRIDGVTVRSVLALAAALGVEVHEERAKPEELEGLEVWALNALHGIRMVTGWIDGPLTAEEPGRFAAWRLRLDALRRPLPATAATTVST